MTLPCAGSLIVTDPEVVLCTCHQTQSSACGPRELFRAAVGKQSLFSGKYRANARPICRRLFSQTVALAAMCARDKDASNMAANAAMIAIVTSSSTKVKASRQPLLISKGQPVTDYWLPTASLRQYQSTTGPCPCVGKPLRLKRPVKHSSAHSPNCRPVPRTSVRLG